MLFLKRFFARIFAFIVVNKIKRSYYKAPEIQRKTLKKLIEKAKNTSFGIEHNFNEIKQNWIEAQERIGDEIVKEIKSFYKFNE